MTSYEETFLTSPHGELALPEAARGALTLWKRLCGGRALPSRANLKPVDWRHWLSDISILELHRGTKRYFVTLHGGRTQEYVGANLHKKYVEDSLTGNALSLALAPYVESERTRQPTFSILQPKLEHGPRYSLSRLVMPFTDATPEGGLNRVDRFVTWVGASSRRPYDMDIVYESISGDTINGDGMGEQVVLMTITI